MTLDEPDSRTRMREAAAMWALSPATTNATGDTILAACDLLAEGVDSPGLRTLAGLPFDSSWLDSRELVERVFFDLSLEFVVEESDLAKLRALAYRARLFLRGDLSARALTHWGWGQIELDGPAVARDLVVLEYVFDGDEQHLWSAEEFEAAVRDEATAFLRAVE